MVEEIVNVVGALKPDIYFCCGRRQYETILQKKSRPQGLQIVLVQDDTIDNYFLVFSSLVFPTDALPVTFVNIDPANFPIRLGKGFWVRCQVGVAGKHRITADVPFLRQRRAVAEESISSNGTTISFLFTCPWGTKLLQSASTRSRTKYLVDHWPKSWFPIHGT